jgi:hypothetical protein
VKEEEFEDTKGVIGIRKWKNRQQNGQRKKVQKNQNGKGGTCKVQIELCIVIMIPDLLYQFQMIPLLIDLLCLTPLSAIIQLYHGD